MTRVLLADDHRIIREGIKTILADTEDLIVCGEASNGTEVLNLIAREEWDLLVLDITMPGRNGLELIKQVRKERPRLPILVLSMHSEEQYALRALHAGASGYVTKESESEVIVAAMHKVAARGIYLSERVAEMLARERMPQMNDEPHKLLSDREYQVFERIVAGRRLTDIAHELSLSIKTVSTHKSRIQQKMGLATHAELVHYAIAHGLGTLLQ
ncbi:MAG: response regulator transcription factor [Rhodocyclaceae bacterium]|nr:response regulator transcription factor [Rhodocyclaceae bacterium]